MPLPQDPAEAALKEAALGGRITLGAQPLWLHDIRKAGAVYEARVTFDDGTPVK